MLNFNMAYTHVIEDYFNPKFEEYYEFEGEFFDAIKEYEDCISAVSDFKQTLKRDIENILVTRVDSLNNNASLVQELQTLIDTVDNEVDYDFTTGVNFAFRTDNFLCFNNFENYVDELEWGELGSDARVCETIVIIDSHLKNYYFIRTTKRLSYDAESTTINAYQVKDKNVRKRKINFKHGLKFAEHNDEGINKMLSLVS